MDNFKDYIWYLLSSPLKRVEKRLNTWWMLSEVIGELFDEALVAFFKARDETMVSTCADTMLPYQAGDRRMTRYRGEDWDNFRRRIANYPKICELGGTDEGIILAVETLGFREPRIVLAKVLMEDDARWAEFYLILDFDLEEGYPISDKILKKVVRDTKETGALDNYLMRFQMEFSVTVGYGSMTDIYNRCYPHPDKPMLILDGSWNLDGTYELSDFFNPEADNFPLLLDGQWELDGRYSMSGSLLDDHLDLYPVTTNCYMETVQECQYDGSLQREVDLWYLDGQECLDGTRSLKSSIEIETL